MADYIIRELKRLRMEMGEKHYGVFNPETNQKNFLLETLVELVDALNYIDMGRACGQKFPAEIDCRLEQLALDVYKSLTEQTRGE